MVEERKITPLRKNTQKGIQLSYLQKTNPRGNRNNRTS